MGKLQKQILPHIDYIREIIEYNPYTGKLFYKPNKYKNKTWHTLYAGREICSKNSDGYIRVSLLLDNKPTIIYGHRIAWLLHYGEEPPYMIDHINTIPWDNRIVNLRETNFKLNRINTSKTVGVELLPEGFVYSITLGGKFFVSPGFTTFEQAKGEREKLVNGLCNAEIGKQTNILIDDVRDLPEMSIICRTVIGALELSDMFSFTGSYLFMDSDLGDPEVQGKDLLDHILFLGQRPLKVVLVTSNPVDAEYMRGTLTSYGYRENPNRLEYDLF